MIYEPASGDAGKDVSPEVSHYPLGRDPGLQSSRSWIPCHSVRRTARAGCSVMARAVFHSCR